MMVKNVFLVLLLVLIAMDICYGQQQAGRITARQIKVQDGVKYITNIPYVENNHARQRLNIMLPEKGSEKPLPVIVFVHGGAWKAGNKSIGIGRLAPYVSSGEYAGVSIGYRLSQHDLWPAQIHDCKAAIRWIRANAEKYGMDKDRIGVWGTSAGGHLVAMLGTSSGVEAMDGELGDNKEISSHIKCVVDYFGPTDILKLAGPRTDRDVSDSALTQLMGGPVWDNKEKTISANPINYVSKDDPPFLIIHGTKDPLVPISQSKMLQDALKAVKVGCTLITVKDGGHGRGFGPKIRDITKEFFDNKLRGIDSKFEDKVVDAEN